MEESISVTDAQLSVLLNLRQDSPPEVEVLDDNTLWVQVDGQTVYKRALDVWVDPETAKVKWSRKKGTLTFTASCTHPGTNSGDSSAEGERAGAKTHTSSGLGDRSAAGEHADVKTHTSSNTGDSSAAGECAAAPVDASASTSTPLGGGDADGEEQEDTGLQEMYGAEMFAVSKQARQQAHAQASASQHRVDSRQGHGEGGSARDPAPSDQSNGPSSSSSSSATTTGLTASSSAAGNLNSSTPCCCGSTPLHSQHHPPSVSTSNQQQQQQRQQQQHQHQQHHQLQQQPLQHNSPPPQHTPHHHAPVLTSDPPASHAPAASSNADAGVPEAPGIDCSLLASTLLQHTTQSGSKAHKASAKKAAKEERRKVAPILDAIADSLGTKGWAVCDDFVPISEVIEVRKEMKRLEEHYTEGEIWVGKEADAGATIARKDVRGDVVLWLDQEALEATAYIKDGQRQSCSFATLRRVIQSIDSLVKEQLPPRAPCLANVRERSDAMMAIYPGRGSRFAKHIDNTAGDGRRLTLLCYLNPNWRQSNGGALRLTPPDGRVVDVYPQAGRLALFLSKSVAHEVMPTHMPRHSFTLWYYDAIERAEAVAAAQVSGRGRASVEEQQEARELIRDMLSRGGEIQASYEGVAALQKRVKHTSYAAMGIVASIVGAPSTQDLLDSIEHMVPSELENLNAQLANMGVAEHAHAPSF